MYFGEVGKRSKFILFFSNNLYIIHPAGSKYLLNANSSGLTVYRKTYKRNPALNDKRTLQYFLQNLYFLRIFNFFYVFCLPGKLFLQVFVQYLFKKEGMNPFF